MAFEIILVILAISSSIYGDNIQHVNVYGPCDDNNTQLLIDLQQQLTDLLVKSEDCQDILSRDNTSTTGVYTIYPAGTKGVQVRCDMDTDGGGWTVFQRRMDNGTDFNRTWGDYEFGFGNLSENFWLGNKQIHTITKQGWYQLRVDLVDQTDAASYATYKRFSVGDDDSLYKLKVSGYSGTAGDSLTFHDKMAFSTPDNDNDPSTGTNCALSYSSGWWFRACRQSNLNEMNGPNWQTLGSTAMKTAEMKIRMWGLP